MRYVTGGAWRAGDDYTAGDGSTVAARFRSAEGRTRVGVQTSTNGTLSLLGSFQAQRDVDFPGRPLDARFFDTYQVQAEYTSRGLRSDCCDRRSDYRWMACLVRWTHAPSSNGCSRGPG
ncbi:MAG: hypothetical protein WEA80_04370 [Gemmatimonadaceae bacterium]